MAAPQPINVEDLDIHYGDFLAVQGVEKQWSAGLTRQRRVGGDGGLHRGERAQQRGRMGDDRGVLAAGLLRRHVPAGLSHPRPEF